MRQWIGILAAGLLVADAHGQLVAGVSLNFDTKSSQSAPNSASWLSLTSDPSQDCAFGTDVTLVSVTSGVSMITRAYRFTGGVGDNNGDTNTDTWDTKYGEGSATSLEFWLKPDDSGEPEQIILESGGSGTGFAVWYAPVTNGDGRGTINFTIDFGAAPSQQTVSAPLDTTEFRHVALVYDESVGGSSNDLMAIYVDGVFVDDNLSVTTGDAVGNDNDDTAIDDFCGGDGTGFGSANNDLAESISASPGSFVGDVAVFRVWSHALTAAEIVSNYAVYAVQPSVLASGVALNWDANDPASGVDGDNWNSLTGPDYYDWDFGADVSLVTGLASSGTTLSNAYRFTGGPADGDNLDWENLSSNSDGSWEFWIKPSDSGTLAATQTVFETGGGGDGLHVWYQPGSTGDTMGALNWTIDNQSVQVTLSATIDTLDFRHVVLVYDRDVAGGSDRMEMYVDYVLEASDSTATNLHDWSGTDNGGLGNFYGSVAQTSPTAGQFHGDLSAFRFWEGKALSTSEVLSNYLVYAVPDSAGPNLLTTSPTNGAAGVHPGIDLVASFDESIVTNTGNLIISNLTDSTRIVIAIGDESQISLVGHDLIINPADPLESPKAYAVFMDAGAIKDVFGNSYDGIASETTWAFSTVPDTDTPSLVSVSPTNNSAGVLVGTSLVAQFDEIIRGDAGNVILSNLTDSTGMVIPMDNPQVSISGTQLVIAPAGGLQYLKSYAVLIETNAVADESGNHYAGITDTTRWGFDTESGQIDGTWGVDASGTWGDPANWVDGFVADGPDKTATFPDVITANRTVTLDADRTIGNLTASDTGQDYSISGGNTLTLDRTTGTPTAAVAGASRTLTISSVIDGTDGVAKTGSGTLSMSGANSFSGDVVISGGTLRFASLGAWGDPGKDVAFTGNSKLTTFDGYTGGQLSVNTGMTATITAANLTFATATGSGNIIIGSGRKTFTLRDGSAFHGSIAITAGGDGGTIRFRTLSDAPGDGNLQFGGGSRDSNQRITISLFNDAGPLTFNHRQIEFLPKPNNWSFRYAILENNNGTPANTFVINTPLLNMTDRNHEFQLGGSNSGDNEFAGVIGDSTRGTYYSTQSGILSLTKVAGGRWILSGANTYSGTTTVSGGRLVLKGGLSLPDAGKLNITSGKVEIEADVKERIDTLQFGGVTQAMGTWGSTASKATNKDDNHFAGTGVLYVGVDFPPTGSVFIVQ